MVLETYRRKRDFRKSPEPRGSTRPRAGRRTGRLRFVVQKHAASRLHYDFRLELEGVLKSWAVPKGPSLDPADKRLAVEVEDHPLEYGDFEGTIPAGQYGAGSVLVWDRGTWEPQEEPREGHRRGRLSFVLHGEKLRGKWLLVRMRPREGESQTTWLLFKERDEWARSGRSRSIVDSRPESVATGRRIEEIGRGRREATWSSDRPASTTGRKRARATADPGASRARISPSRTRAAAPREPTSPPRAEIARALRSAPAATLPAQATPQLATLVSSAPDGEDWLHEIKFDGYRALIRIDRGQVRLFTRSGQDWTGRFLPVADDATRLPARQALVDGEVVVMEPDGRTSFQALQNALRRGREADLVCFVFDLLHLDGRDLTGLPLATRKEALRDLLARAKGTAAIRYSDHVRGRGKAFHAEACRSGLEGIVSKRSDAPYRSTRTHAWLKVKCSQRQELVIGGFTEPQGSRAGLGALLVGAHSNGTLRYCGRVGTGFTQDLLRDLRKRLGKIERAEPPFQNPPRGGRTVHWVEPRLVAEVSFTGWTDDGLLRHPSFQGLREDKPASEAVLERPVPLEKAAAGDTAGPGRSSRSGKKKSPREPPPRPTRHGPPKRDPDRKKRIREPPAEEPPRPPIREPPGETTPELGAFRGVVITHPDRVLDPSGGISKRDVAHYVDQIAELMLPHVADRPLMLLRCPEGRAKPCFIQKHPSTPVHDSIRSVRVRERQGPRPYLSIRDATGLVALVQMGALEIHVWGARADRDEAPDRVVFDLDPGPSVPWAETTSTAHRLREAIEELGLRPFVKTTGGKGLHVVVPIRRGPRWDEVARFGTALALGLVQERPERFTTRMEKSRRSGKILIDTLRNRRGATWVAPYSPRAREGIPVSTPIDWTELTSRLRPERLTVRTVPGRARGDGDPWRDMAGLGQAITRSMLERLEARSGGKRL